MTTPAVKGELLINGTWVDVTALGRVRVADKIAIQRGYLNEQGDTITPSTCGFAINNADGLFSDRNPNSQYFGLLGQNTQARFSVTTGPPITDTFTRTVSGTGTWGTSDTGDVWGSLSLGGATLNTDYAVTGTEATHLVPALSAYRLSRIAAYNDINQTVRATFKVAQATGGNLEPCNIILRGTSTTSYFMIRCEVTPTNVVQLRIINRGLGISAAVDTGITHTGTGQPVTVVAQADGHFIRAKAYIASGVEPLTWQIYGYDNTPTPGYAGVRSGIAASNTNALPVVFTYDNFSVISDDYRHWGEISEFPQYWDLSGSDVWVPVVSSDILRRLTQGAQPLQSPIYRYINALPAKNGYWTFQDATNATEAGSAVAGAQAATISDITFGFDASLPGSSGVAHVNSTSSVLRGAGKTVPASTYASAMWMFRYDTAPASSATVMNVIGTGTVKRWNVSVDTTTFNITAYDKDDVQLNTSAIGFGTGVLPSQWITMRLQIHVVAGNIAVELGWSSLGQGFAWGVTNNSFVAGTSPGIFTSWNVPIGSGNVGLNLSHLVLSTAAISNADTGFLAATNAHLGEAVDARIIRACAQAGVDVEIMQNVGVAQTMGYQPIGTLIDVLQECARVDGGYFTAGRGFFGLVYRARETLYMQTSLALSYSAGHFSGELKPTDDDQTLRNDVTVTRPSGGSARSIVVSGRKGTAQVGTYDTQYPLNPSADADLVYLSQQATAIGTWDDLRWPTVQVDLAGSVFTASATLRAGVRALDAGDPIAISGLPAWLPPDTAEVMVRGWREVMGDQQWQFVFNTQPYGPYRSVNDLDTTGKGRYRAAATNSYLANTVASGATSMVVKTPTGARWRRSSGAPAGTYPMNAVVSGEVVTVSALADVTLAFVAAGTASHANNASVTPGVPAGLAQNDFMVMLAAIRGTSATVNTPAGWTLLTSSANVSLFAKLAGASESAPTVSFTGGAAGDDTSAQIAAFRPSSALSATSALTEFVKASAWQTNGSAQDIAYAGAGLHPDFLDNGVVLFLGWKQDDWTSVVSPGTEIAEFFTTTGNDQGLVWAYTIQTTRTQVDGGSFVVTGGAAAVSKGAVVLIHPRHQLLTVTRSLNGIVKAPAAGAPVQVSDSFYVAL